MLNLNMVKDFLALATSHTNDDLATALEDRVQGLVDENGDGLGGLGIVVRIVAGLLC